MIIFTIMIMVKVSQVYTYAKKYKIAHFKYTEFIVFNNISMKLLKTFLKVYVISLGNKI